MQSGPLLVEVAAGVAGVTIDHPPFNLVDGAFIQALNDLLDRAERDPAIRVLLFSSADPDFFLMHGDVEGILAMPSGPGSYRKATVPNLAAATFERMRTSRVVS